MVAEQPLHIRHRLERRGVGRDAQAIGRRHALGQLLAVLGVIVPAPALRLIAVHQDARRAAHVAIEELHAQLRLARGPAAKTVVAADEAAILANLDRQPRPFRKGGQMLGQPPLAAFGHHHRFISAVVQRPGQFAGDRAAVVRIVDAHIAHIDAPPLQPLGVIAYGGEDQGQLLLVMPDIGRLVANLGHQNRVDVRVQILQRRQVVRQLIAQHQPKHGHALFPSPGPFASERLKSRTQAKEHPVRLLQRRKD